MNKFSILLAFLFPFNVALAEEIQVDAESPMPLKLTTELMVDTCSGQVGTGDGPKVAFEIIDDICRHCTSATVLAIVTGDCHKSIDVRPYLFFVKDKSEKLYTANVSGKITFVDPQKFTFLGDDKGPAPNVTCSCPTPRSQFKPERDSKLNWESIVHFDQTPVIEIPSGSRATLRLSKKIKVEIPDNN